MDILIEPATEDVRELMQLLAECSESDRCGAVATVFRAVGDVDVKLGARAVLYPDGTLDGQLMFESIFDDLRNAANSTVKRYETFGGYVDVFLEVIDHARAWLSSAPVMTFCPSSISQRASVGTRRWLIRTRVFRVATASTRLMLCCFAGLRTCWNR